MKRIGSFLGECSKVSSWSDGLLLRFQMRIRKIAPKVLQLLTEWTETFPYDFRDDRMMRSLKELTHRLASGDEVCPAPPHTRSNPAAFDDAATYQGVCTCRKGKLQAQADFCR